MPLIYYQHIEVLIYIGPKIDVVNNSNHIYPEVNSFIGISYFILGLTYGLKVSDIRGLVAYYYEEQFINLIISNKNHYIIIG